MTYGQHVVVSFLDWDYRHKSEVNQIMSIHDGELATTSHTNRKISPAPGIEPAQHPIVRVQSSTS